MKRNSRDAFTLVELLVVIAIIAIMVSIMLPSINALRESARRASCIGRVSQIITAVHNYEMAAEVYPTGVINDSGPVLNQPQGFHHGWLGQLLPYLEEMATYSHVDRDVSVYHKNNKPVRDIYLPVFTCPSAPGGWMIAARSCYAGVHHDVEAPIDDDNHGMFFLNSRLRYEDVTDGITQTLFVGEKFMDPSTDLGWLSGTRGTLRNTGTPINMTGKNPPAQFVPLPDRTDADKVEVGPDATTDTSAPSDAEEPLTPEAATETDNNGSESTSGSEDVDAASEKEQPADAEADSAGGLLYVGGFGSHHSGGAVFAFGDGNVRFITEAIDQTVYEQLGHRADGKLLDRRSID